MPTNRIYHYTNIDSLALILKTRNLRFTRLDGVDDVREAQYHAGINFGKFFFVSCWTQESEENIPLWNMYSREMQGVRLELPEFPFVNHPLRPNPEWDGIECEDGLNGPLPFEALCGSSYFIVPMFFNRDHFAGPIEYVPSVEEVYVRSIRREIHANGRVNLGIDGLPMLPRHKSREWSFQKEYRFSLFVLPSLPVTPDGSGTKTFTARVSEHMSQSFINNIDPGITYIDIPLDPSVFQELIVRMGPLCSSGGQASVEALVSRFAPEARIEQSVLIGAIRPRDWSR